MRRTARSWRGSRRTACAKGQLTASYAMAENVFAVSQSAPGGCRRLRVEREALTRDRRVRVCAEGARESTVVLVSNGPPLETTELIVVLERGRNARRERRGRRARASRRASLRRLLRARGSHRRAHDERRASIAPAISGSSTMARSTSSGGRRISSSCRGETSTRRTSKPIAARVNGVNAGRVVAFGVDEERSGTQRLVVLGRARRRRGRRQRCGAPIGSRSRSVASSRRSSTAAPRRADRAGALAGEVDVGQARAWRQPRASTSRFSRAPRLRRRSPRRASRARRSPTARDVARSLSRRVGARAVGLSDDYFALGGDSLQAVLRGEGEEGRCRSHAGA